MIGNSSGSGVNIAGGDITIAPGAGSGTGDPGELIIKLSPDTGSTGDTVNTLQVVLSVVKGGHLDTGVQTAPAVTSCGTSPTITGTDTAGKVTIGSSASSTCTLTFEEAYANAPSCVLTNGTVDVPVWATTSTTVLTITDGAGDFSSDVIMYICVGL